MDKKFEAFRVIIFLSTDPPLERLSIAAIQRKRGLPPAPKATGAGDRLG